MKTIILITIIITVLNHNSYTTYGQQDDLQKRSIAIDSFCNEINKNLLQYQKLEMPYTPDYEDEPGWIAFTCYFDNEKIVKIHEYTIVAEAGDSVEMEIYFQSNKLILASEITPISETQKRVVQYYFFNNKMIKVVEDHEIISVSDIYLNDEGKRIKNNAKWIIKIINKYKKK